MAIPDYHAFFGPFLEALADGQPRPTRVVVRAMGDRFALTDEERERRVPSGQQTYLANRVGWARTYLKKAGLIDQVRRGVVRITPEGQRVLAEKPAAIDHAFLRRYDSFRGFERGEAGTIDPPIGRAVDPPIEATPDETIEAAYATIRRALAADLLTQIAACSPTFFERLVIRLLLAMGYGYPRPDAGRHVGGSGDGGIDGLINEDKLGLDVICLQAKRWQSSVGRPVVQAFVGSMEAYRAKKGVLITTSTFTADARDYLQRVDHKIVLIDGERLAELMIDHDVGVSTAQTYAIKRVDGDFFTEDDV